MLVRRILLSGLFALIAAGPAIADPPRVEPNSFVQVQDRDDRQLRIRPLREVLDMLRARYGGEYVSHRLEDGPRPVYVIRWRMPDGVTVRDFRIDAVSGQ